MSKEKAEAGIDKKIMAVIVDNLGVDEADVVPGASLRDDLGADSLDETELVMAFEEAYDVSISDDETDAIKTVQDIVDLVVAKTAKAGK